eukprot:3861074-Lingulodinium_polyedra.AAC.1
MPTLKPARFLSSSPAILDRLSLRCRGARAHQPLSGPGRASAAAVYPPGLCRAILKGVEEQRCREGASIPPAVLSAVDQGIGIYSLAAEDPATLPDADFAGEQLALDP